MTKIKHLSSSVVTIRIILNIIYLITIMGISVTGYVQLIEFAAATTTESSVHKLELAAVGGIFIIFFLNLALLMEKTRSTSLLNSLVILLPTCIAAYFLIKGDTRLEEMGIFTLVGFALPYLILILLFPLYLLIRNKIKLSSYLLLGLSQLPFAISFLITLIICTDYFLSANNYYVDILLYFLPLIPSYYLTFMKFKRISIFA